MPYPEPRRGLVIRYAFLWSHEHARGAIEASKDRPCGIIVAKVWERAENPTVVVLPITHAPPPEQGRSHLKLTGEECRAIGLDNGEHWVVLDEMNQFPWPGYDLRRIPGTERFD